MPATVTPLSPDVGVEISGVRGRDLVSRRAADDCLAALQKHGVVVYREVGIDDDDLVAFSRLLGEVVVAPTGEHEHPEIQTITLDRLLAWSTQPRFVLRHRWRRGDLVIWDSTGMLHRALPFEPRSRRLLHRTTLVGEEAVA